MNIGIEAIIDNLGISLEGLLVLVLFLGSMLFAAKDFKIAVIVLIGSMAGLVVWFYETGLNWNLPLMVMFIGVVILVFTLRAVDKTSTTGGIV